MTRPSDPALELARRLAAGERIDAAELAAAGPELAAGLARLASIRRALAPEGETGATWGHLQQLEAAGSGSFGEVYRAFDPTLDRHVALKLKRRDVHDGPFSGRDFVAEARRLARVRHPNVLAVHGASYHDGRAGLWSDWIEGETLHARLQHAARPSPDDVLRIAGELAAALAAVHEAGIVHGDVKAANVMIDARGHSLLMDFGAGFATGEDPVRLSHGTPRYLAPEVLRGETAGSAVDVFALGVLLHRVACDRYPESGRVASDLAPRALRALVREMMRDAPEQRPSAPDLVRRIDAIRTAPLRRARRLASGTIIAASALTAVVSALALVRVDAARDAAEAALLRSGATNRFLSDLLGHAAPDRLGPNATLAELLELAPAEIERRENLGDIERADLLRSLSDIEAGLSNDAAAALHARAAAALAKHSSPDADSTLVLEALALRREAIAGQAESARSTGEALLARAERESRPAALIAQIELALAEAEFRAGLIRSDAQLAVRSSARIEHALAQPGIPVADEVDAWRRLATLRIERGDVAGALEASARAVSRAEAGFGADSPAAALSRRVHAWNLLETPEPARAEALFRDNLRRHADKLGQRSRNVVDDRMGLAYALSASGKAAQALPEAEAAWSGANALYPADHRTTIDAGLTLIAAQLAQGDVKGAREVVLDLRARLAHGRGRDNRQFVQLTRELAAIEARLGNFGEADTLWRECEQIGTQALGSDSPLVRDCLAQRNARAR